MHFVRGGIGALVALCCSAQAIAAPPAPRCWEMTALDSVRVTELHTMLMAVTLRCKAAGIDIRASYDGFVKAQRKGLDEAHQAVRLHYGEARKKLGQGAYDQYLTSIANFYGSGRTDAATCRSFELIGSALADGKASPDLLAAVARQAVRDPQLDAPMCTMTAEAR